MTDPIHRQSVSTNTNNPHAEILRTLAEDLRQTLLPEQYRDQRIRDAEKRVAPDGKLIPAEFRATDRDIRLALFERFAASTDVDSLTRIVAFEQDSSLRLSYCTTLGRALHLGVFGKDQQPVTELLSTLARSPSEDPATRSRCAVALGGALHEALEIGTYVFLDAKERASLAKLESEVRDLAPHSKDGQRARSELRNFKQTKGLGCYGISY